jgi:hypothetical protein
VGFFGSVVFLGCVLQLSSNSVGPIDPVLRTAEHVATKNASALTYIAAPPGEVTKSTNLPRYSLSGVPASVVSGDETSNFTISGTQLGEVWRVRFVGPAVVSAKIVTAHVHETDVFFALPQPGIYRVEVELAHGGEWVGKRSNCTAEADLGECMKACDSAGVKRICDNKKDREKCTASRDEHFGCMETCNDMCSAPVLVRTALETSADPIVVVANGPGFVSPQSAAPCADAQSALGDGVWIDMSVVCENNPEFSSHEECEWAILPVDCRREQSLSPLAVRLCDAPFVWRPLTCSLTPLSDATFLTQARDTARYLIL